jgi:hypothetical protein
VTHAWAQRFFLYVLHWQHESVVMTAAVLVRRMAAMGCCPPLSSRLPPSPADVCSPVSVQRWGRPGPGFLALFFRLYNLSM